MLWMALNPYTGNSPYLLNKHPGALSSHISPPLAQMFNISIQTTQVPEHWRRAIVTRVPQNRPKIIQTHKPHACRLQNP